MAEGWSSIGRDRREIPRCARNDGCFFWPELFGCGRRGLCGFSAKNKQKHNTEQYRCCAGGLGVGHAEEGTRINANDFDKKAGDAGENQVAAEDQACGFFPAQYVRAYSPEQVSNQHPDEKFVERCGMNSTISRPALLHASLRRGNHANRETHSPRKIGGNSIVAIATEQAADASDGVADTGSRTARVKKRECGNFFAPTEN